MPYLFSFEKEAKLEIVICCKLQVALYGLNKKQIITGKKVINIVALRMVKFGCSGCKKANTSPAIIEEI